MTAGVYEVLHVEVQQITLSSERTLAIVSDIEKA